MEFFDRFSILAKFGFFDFATFDINKVAMPLYSCQKWQNRKIQISPKSKIDRKISFFPKSQKWMFITFLVEKSHFWRFLATLEPIFTIFCTWANLRLPRRRKREKITNEILPRKRGLKSTYDPQIAQNRFWGYSTISFRVLCVFGIFWDF